MSASYPYLAFARATGLDYGIVLSFIDAYQGAAITCWHERAAEEMAKHPRKRDALIKLSWDLKTGRAIDAVPGTSTNTT